MHRAQFVTHFGIHHQEAQRTAAALEPIAPRQLTQLHVGVLHQQVEVVGLGDLAERTAVARTDQRGDTPPALMLGSRGIDLGEQCLALAAALVIVDQLGTGLGAALVGLLALLQLLGMALLQPFDVRRFGLLQFVRVQATEAAVQTLATAGQGFGVLLQALARLGNQLVIHVQQLGEGGVVQLRVAGAPGGQLRIQRVAFLFQFGLALATVLLLAVQPRQANLALVELPINLGLGLPRSLDGRVQLLLPGAGAGLFAKAGT